MDVIEISSSESSSSACSLEVVAPLNKPTVRRQINFIERPKLFEDQQIAELTASLATLSTRESQPVPICSEKILRGQFPEDIRDFWDETEQRFDSNITTFNGILYGSPGSDFYLRPGGKETEASITPLSDELNQADIPYFPKDVIHKLLSYQIEGVVWFTELFKLRKGGILADDMGLGKTIQSIIFVSSMIQSRLASHALIICPKAVISSWIKEFHKWSDIEVFEFHGAPYIRRSEMVRAARHKEGACVFTTYETLVKDISLLRALKKKDLRCITNMEKRIEQNSNTSDSCTRPWDIVILDEGHSIKSKKAKKNISCNAIESTSRFVLTGTPLENSLEEYYNLFDFVSPGLLGPSAEFKREYVIPIKEGSTKNATWQKINTRNKLLEKIQSKTSQFILRRIKENLTEENKQSLEGIVVKTIVAKTEVVLWDGLTTIQQKIYSHQLKSRTVAHIVQDLSRKKEEKVSKHFGHVFETLNSLLFLTVHPLLFFRDLSFKIFVISKDPADLVIVGKQPEPIFREAFEQMKRMSLSELRNQSWKLKRLYAIISGLIEEDHRILIFSYSCKILDLIEWLILQPLGIEYLRYDGKVKKEDRSAILDQFDEDLIPVLLLSTKAGGTGLTIIGADRVIIVNPSWNPALDAQAIDRTHRIGQTKNVVAYRLVCGGTVEDHMLRLQLVKKKMSSMLLDKRKMKSYFNVKDLKKLFSLEPWDSVETKNLLDQAYSDENV